MTFCLATHTSSLHASSWLQLALLTADCCLLHCAGSAAYGFWYRMLTNPEGPSTTTTSCPKFTPLAAFKDNVAHSNMFYGLRIFPEYYPKVNPCDSSYNQLPAVFDGLVSYKNGMKCAIATQVRQQVLQTLQLASYISLLPGIKTLEMLCACALPLCVSGIRPPQCAPNRHLPPAAAAPQVGLVQFRNFTVADCGAGPKAHVVNGKDHGGALEITWVSDDRNRLTTPLNNMAGGVTAGLQGRQAINRAAHAVLQAHCC
jgi:hypothetical protein